MYILRAFFHPRPKMHRVQKASPDEQLGGFSLIKYHGTHYGQLGLPISREPRLVVVYLTIPGTTESADLSFRNYGTGASELAAIDRGPG